MICEICLKRVLTSSLSDIANSHQTGTCVAEPVQPSALQRQQFTYSKAISTV